MSTTQATSAPPVAAESRPSERASRLSNGIIPILLIAIAVGIHRRRSRRRRAMEAMRERPPTPPL